MFKFYGLPTFWKCYIINVVSVTYQKIIKINVVSVANGSFRFLPDIMSVLYFRLSGYVSVPFNGHLHLIYLSNDLTF